MEPSPELEAIARRFIRARSESDFETIKNLTSESEHALLIGSDSGDWLEGGPAGREAMRVDWADYEVARDEIVKFSGTQFDPKVVQTFLKIPQQEFDAIRDRIRRDFRRRQPAEAAETR